VKQFLFVSSAGICTRVLGAPHIEGVRPLPRIPSQCTLCPLFCWRLHGGCWVLNASASAPAKGPGWPSSGRSQILQGLAWAQHVAWPFCPRVSLLAVAGRREG